MGSRKLCGIVHTSPGQGPSRRIGFWTIFPVPTFVIVEWPFSQMHAISSACIVFSFQCDQFQRIAEPRCLAYFSFICTKDFRTKLSRYIKKKNLLINGNEVDVCILIRREKYQSISWITNSSSSSTAVNKGTNCEKNTLFYLWTLQIHSIVSQKIVLQVSLHFCCNTKKNFSYLAELGGSYCITQWIFGISTPRPITSVHKSTPL